MTSIASRMLSILKDRPESSDDICESAIIKTTEGDEFIEDDATYPWALINGYLRDNRILRFIQEEEEI